MGKGRWDSTAYAGFTTSAAAYDSRSATMKTMSTDKIFTKRTLAKALDPMLVTVRESRDSADNPAATPVIMALDVTGSMGMIADSIAKEGLGVFFKEVLTRLPVTDPHLMFMAIGDAEMGDAAPLQVSQFEADGRIIEQLVDIYLEHGGGGNGTESYQFPWYFAAMHTATDAFEKRGEKGFLITIGDEEAPAVLRKEDILRICGEEVERDYTPAELLKMASEMYHCLHVVILEGSHCLGGGQIAVRESWNALMGQNVIYLENHKKLSEVVISAMQIIKGADKKDVAKSWSGDTALVVANATRDLTAAAGSGLATAGGVKRF